MRWAFDCWLLTEVDVYLWTCWCILDTEDCDLLYGSWRGLLQCCCASFRQSTVTDIMDTPGFGSPIQSYRDNLHRMRLSNDEDGSDPKNLCSLGVVDLDLSLSPDVFGLQAFDSKLPLTRMLPGSNPCELRLMLPDSTMGADGFHDVVIENLSASPAWRSSHVSPPSICSSSAGVGISS